MDKLKALLKERSEILNEVVGDKKWLKHAEQEELELERAASRRQAKKPRVDVITIASATAEAPAKASEGHSGLLHAHSGSSDMNELSDDEIRRRLRRLGQPTTLFGEDSKLRRRRLKYVEATLDVADEEGDAGENELLTIQKEERRRAAEEADAAVLRISTTPTPGVSPIKVSMPGEASNPAPAAPAEGSAESDAMRMFREAAQRLAWQRELEQLPPAERIVRRFQKYMQEWKEDLDARPLEAVQSTVGVQITNGYRQAQKAFETLYARLRADEVHSEIKACLIMIIDAMEQRNYQRANEIYLQLSIGNQQWPIGVTSVGIHERKAREKISHYANEKSQAHIMNDEATRKYLHGVSRLIKAVQGLRPTDPSRSANFNAIEHAGLGAKGGRPKERLLELKAAGEAPHLQGRDVAPSFMAPNGGVQIPQKWGRMLREHENKW